MINRASIGQAVPSRQSTPTALGTTNVSLVPPFVDEIFCIGPPPNSTVFVDKNPEPYTVTVLPTNPDEGVTEEMTTGMTTGGCTTTSGTLTGLGGAETGGATTGTLGAPEEMCVISVVVVTAGDDVPTTTSAGGVA